MDDLSAIQEHMEVIGADGTHIGTVDHIEGDRIKLTRTDPGAGGEHHYLPLSLLADVDGGKVRTSFDAALVGQFWVAG